MATTEAAEPIALGEYPQKNKKSGASELVRISTIEFGGYFYTGLRVFYQVHPKGPDDDGWRPDKDRGVSVREPDLDTVIDALTEARRIIHEQGRSTSRTSAPQSKPRRSTLGVEPVGQARPQRQDQGNRQTAPWETNPETTDHF